MFFVLHTFMINIYSVLAMLAYNIDDATIMDAIRPLLAVLILTTLILLIIRLIIRDWAKASLVSTGFLILFLSYGHIYSILRDSELGGIYFGRHGLMLPSVALLAILWAWWVVKKLQNPEQVVRFFNVVGMVLLVFPLYTIVTHQVREAQYRQRSQIILDPIVRNAKSSSGPDIYYIILDGYAQADVLNEIYDYDNLSFINFLTGHGFYVAKQAHSNYNQTALSLAASLNMKYINQLADTMGRDNKDRTPLAELIKDSKLSELIRSHGYRIVAFESGYERTEIRNADYYWSLSNEVVPQLTYLWKFNAFESLLLESTMIRAIFDLHLLSTESLREMANFPEYQAHRERVLFAFERLDDIATMDGDYFVFAHIISPHPPFVFGPHGEEITPDSAYQIADGDNYPGDTKEYLQGYRDQVTFINSQIAGVIDQILEKSTTPPIIVLQGDHGPGAYLVWDSPKKSNLNERFSILNAYYLPGGGEDWLYSTISPINTFRVILTHYFGANYPLLSDESYFAPWMKPYDLTRVTDRFSQ